MAKECTLNIGKLSLGRLHRNNVLSISGRPDMTSTVFRGRKVSINTTTNKPSSIYCIYVLMTRKKAKQAVYKIDSFNL